MVVPFLIVCAIYSSAYTLAMVLGIPQSSPAWQGVRAIANVGISLVAMSTFGLLGALAEELGWRGYLQPRLDELRVRNSLLWVIAIETLYHLPLVLFGGYLGGANRLATVALFISLSFGVVPLWTWATYRWRTIWIAVWFHTFHNGISQITLPNLLGAGSPLLLGESGVLPVFMYLVTAGIVFGRMRSRGQHWPDVVDQVLTARVARIQS